jgi:replication factor A1
LHAGEIKATGFQASVDKFYDLFQVGKVYRIRGGSLKPANARFSNLKNSFEISFNDSTEVVLVEDAGHVPEQKVPRYFSRDVVTNL